MRTNCTTALEKKRGVFFYPFTHLVLFYLLSLGIFSASRLALYLQYFETVREVENHLRIFSVGFRLDTMMLCHLLAPPFLAQLCFPARISTRFGSGFSLYFALLASLFVFLEIFGFAFSHRIHRDGEENKNANKNWNECDCFFTERSLFNF